MMKTFYFVGGPKPADAAVFFQRLKRIGGPPAGWQIYPHAGDDGKALHVVKTESLQNVVDHLKAFEDIYECSEIIEIRGAPQLAAPTK